MSTISALQQPSILRDSPARSFRQLLVIFLAGLFIYGWKLGDAPIAGTEPLRALVAHQMVQNGNLLIPRINGELYLRKPPLQYWVIAAAEKITGNANEWVWRAPSAIGSALLAVFLGWWAARWFGSRARLIAGFGCLALIALWAQDRGADIDALDTLASVLAACSVLEIAFGPTRRPHYWMLAMGISTGAMLLLKGPAGLPPLLSAIGACFIFARGRATLRRPWLWAGLVIGAIIFFAWLLAVYHRVQIEHLVVDRSGAQEAEERMLLRSPSAIFRAVEVPFLVLIYALPVSVGLPWSLRLARSLSSHSIQRMRILAIATTIAGSLIIGIAAGIINPRYSYVCMPLIAPLLGASIAIAWERREALRLDRLTRFACILWLIVHVVFTITAFHKIGQIDPREQVNAPTILLLSSAFISLVVAIIAMLGSSIAPHRRAIALASMIILLAVPFAEMKNAERTHFSGRAAGRELRQAMGSSAEVSVAAINRDLPQLLFYAGVPVHAFGEKNLSDLARAPGARWVLLNEPEYKQIESVFPGSLTRITELKMVNDTDFLAWYEPHRPATEMVP